MSFGESIIEYKLRRYWPAIFTAVSLTFVMTYFLGRGDNPVLPPKTVQIGYGIATFAGVLFLLLYRIRKAVYKYRIGSLNAWMIAHKYIAVLAFIALIFHVRFQLGGFYGMLLFAFFTGVAVNGILGAILYQTIPLEITKYNREVLLRQAYIDRLDASAKAIEEFAAGKGESLQNTYITWIKPIIRTKGPKWTYFFTEESAIESKLGAYFENIEHSADKKNIYQIKMLERMTMDHEKLMFKYTKVELLRAWLSVHVPLVSGMVVLLAGHLFLVAWY